MTRLVVVSPVRDEAEHLQRVVDGMAAQTRPPDEWIVVDDGSTDATPEILRAAAERLPFVRVLRAPEQPLPRGADRLAHAAAPRVFAHGIRCAGSFTHVGKLDGDIELAPDYFERLLARFDADPTLGIAGGVVVEEHDGRWVPHGQSHREHVRGALRVYTRACLEDVGGIAQVLGWDGIDIVLAHRHGYRTRSYPELVARHHRPTGTAQGALRGHRRWGRCQYVQGFPAWWVLPRAGKVALSRPRGVAGAVYLAGYAEAALRRVPRFDADGYRETLRAELRVRARARLAALRPDRRRPGGPVAPAPAGEERPA